jgi:uncharacterized protein (TIGR02246 family)
MRSESMPMADDAAIARRYHEMLAGWNARSGEAYAAPLAEDAEVIGFDGSQHSGRAEIASDMDGIFADHATAAYVAKVRRVRRLAPDVAVIHAVAGMVPPGGSDLMPTANAVHTAVLVRRDGQWEIAIFQNTPAQFHGRPELVDSLTEELRQVLSTSSL